MDDNSVGLANPSIEQGQIVPQFQVDSEMLKRAVDYVETSKTRYESQRQTWSTKLVEMDRAYRAILESDRVYRGFDDKASPLIHDNVEAIVARIKESILPTDQRIVDIETNNEQLKPLMDKRAEQLEWQAEKQNIEDKVDILARQLVKFGTAYVKCILVNEEKTTFVRKLVTTTNEIPIVDDNNEQIINPQTGQPEVQIEQKQEVQVVPHVDKKYFGPGYNVVLDPEDIFVDMFIEDIQDQPIVIHRMLVGFDHLMQGVEKGIYFPEQVNKIKGQIVNQKTSFTKERRSQDVLGTLETFGTDTLQGTGSKPKEYELFQAWCDFAVKGKNEAGEDVESVYPCVISIIGNEVIQLQPNPYFHQMKPFNKCTYRRLEGENNGLSAIDPVLDLYHELNDTMNQVNDAKILALNPVKIQRAGSLADKQDLDIYPGAVWLEKQPGDIRAFSMDFGPVANGLQYIGLLEQRINQGMGVTPLMQGSGDDADLDKTWRGTQKVIAQADKKFKGIARHIENNGIKDWFEMAYKVNVQFNPVQGELTFEDINAEISFKVQGVSSFFENQENIQKYIGFTTQAASLPGINTAGLIQQIAEMQGIEIDPRFGPLYQQPPPPPPEDKPLNVTTTIPLDMSKGGVIGLAAAQVLQQKGINIDIDAILQASRAIDEQTTPLEQAKGGTLPASFDSYRKSDSRSAKVRKKKGVEVNVKSIDAEVTPSG